MGNLLQILTVRRFQLAGHRPLALVGGATGLIGDPKMTGERTLNPAEVVDEWVTRIRGQLERFFDFGGDNAAVMVDNYDWTKDLTALEFLRDVGKHFSVNRMLDREAVAARLAGPGISYTEFSYQLLQSYDYLQLYRRHGCTLQTGGSDQWGNIVAGVELVRRADGGRVHALTTPLVTRADGTKFGKTESGTVWLDPALTSPYAFFQFWLNVEDAIVPGLLRMFSFRRPEQIEVLEQSLREKPAGPRGAAGPRRGAHRPGARRGRADPGPGGRGRAVRPGASWATSTPRRWPRRSPRPRMPPCRGPSCSPASPSRTCSR